MKKEFSRNDIAAIKRAAASIAPLITKKNKLLQKKNSLDIEIETIQNRINSYNVPIIGITGYTTEDLVTRDNNGNFALKYPETIIPNTEEAECNAEHNEVDDLPFEDAPKI